MDDRIIDYADYGSHIPLKCKNHPNKRWNTKNILFIGARSIFYSRLDQPEPGTECDCPISDLIPLTVEEAKAEGWQ